MSTGTSLFSGSGYVKRLVQLLVEGSSSDQLKSERFGEDAQLEQPERSFCRQCLLLLFCVGGLLSSYLVWGMLQERIMVYQYKNVDSDVGELFTNSQFIVFANRILAFLVACATMLFVKQKPHDAPLYKYSYSSFSNIMSSWCQYEALKFVSFPVQVIIKIT